MRLTPGPAVNRTLQQLVSLASSVAVAMTMVRLAAASDSAWRADGRPREAAGAPRRTGH